MSWSDPCSTCERHRADCECHKNKLDSFKNHLAVKESIERGTYTKFEKLTFEEVVERYGNVLSKEEIKRIKDFLYPPLKYLETLPKAYEIYEKLFGKPKTHVEWAERFNKVGDINRILMK